MQDEGCKWSSEKCHIASSIEHGDGKFHFLLVVIYASMQLPKVLIGMKGPRTTIHVV